MGRFFQQAIRSLKYAAQQRGHGGFGKDSPELSFTEEPFAPENGDHAGRQGRRLRARHGSRRHRPSFHGREAFRRSAGGGRRGAAGRRHFRRNSGAGSRYGGSGGGMRPPRPDPDRLYPGNGGNFGKRSGKAGPGRIDPHQAGHRHGPHRLCGAFRLCGDHPRAGGSLRPARAGHLRRLSALCGGGQRRARRRALHRRAARVLQT